MEEVEATEMEPKHWLTLLAAALAFVIQIIYGSLPLGAVAALAAMLIFRVIKWKDLDEFINGGVGLITTVHGDSIEDIKNRKELKNLLDEELFKKVILLSAKKGPGTIEKIYDLQEKRWYFAN